MANHERRSWELIFSCPCQELDVFGRQFVERSCKSWSETLPHTLLVNYMCTKYNCNFYVRDGEWSIREVASDVLMRIQVEFSLFAIESELVLCRLRIQEEFAQGKREKGYRRVWRQNWIKFGRPPVYVHNIYGGWGEASFELSSTSSSSTVSSLKHGHIPFSAIYLLAQHQEESVSMRWWCCRCVVHRQRTRPFGQQSQPRPCCLIVARSRCHRC